MGKFGKKVVVNTDLCNYVIGFLAPSGFGKSTLLSRVAEKEYGPEGYIAIDFGQEDGYATISGAIAETCTTFSHFKEVVDDIVMNKERDYPNLKLVILDTIDAGYDICETYTVREYNREHQSDKDFKKATSINSVEGGFGHGLDRCIETFKGQLAKLKSVGVGYWYAGHCKEKEITDMFTGNSFTQLTTSMTQKYFGSIKDISHVIAFGYYDREVEHQDIGKENPVTKKKKGRDAVLSETRRVKFRDDGYLVDAKSRFPDIVPEIDLDRDTFINAIKDAINAAGGKPLSNNELKQIEKAQNINATSTDNEPPFEVEDTTAEDKVAKQILINEIRSKFATADADTRVSIKTLLIENGDGKLESATIDVLNRIQSILGE